jgi:DNA-binding CsgD family transcriptional regulator
VAVASAPDIAALAEYHWGRWEAAIHARDDVALGALDRLLEGMASVTVSGIPSERQLDVVQCLSRGMRNAEVADWLGIGRETVKSHVANAKRAVDAASTTHLVAICWRAGWIT